MPSGSRVLDVAAGYGEPALTAARRAGPEGGVVATDISAEMLAFGRERPAADGFRNVDFVESDASSLAFPYASFDAAVSRWGIIDHDGVVCQRQRWDQLGRGGRQRSAARRVAWRGIASGTDRGRRCRCPRRRSRRTRTPKSISPPSGDERVAATHSDLVLRPLLGATNNDPLCCELEMARTTREHSSCVSRMRRPLSSLGDTQAVSGGSVLTRSQRHCATRRHTSGWGVRPRPRPP